MEKPNKIIDRVLLSPMIMTFLQLQDVLNNSSCIFLESPNEETLINSMELFSIVNTWNEFFQEKNNTWDEVNSLKQEGNLHKFLVMMAF
jgi:hypothetical protein